MGQSGLVKPAKTVHNIVSGHVIVSLWGTHNDLKFSTFRRLLWKCKCWAHFASFNWKCSMLHLNTDPHLTPDLAFLLVLLWTSVMTHWYRAVGPWSSYNNIALWRSPECTGKCCLCALKGRGCTELRGCLYNPNNSLHWVWKGQAEKGPVWGSKGPLYTCMLHLWRWTKCESVPEGV